MTKSVVVVTEDTPVAQVAALLLERRFSGIPVLSSDQRVLGIITANELFTADHSVHIPTFVNLLTQTNFFKRGVEGLSYSGQQLLRTTAKDIMNQNVLFVRPELEIEKLAAYIGETWNDAVPVTDAENRLLGIVTKTDVAKMVGRGITPPTLVGRFRERPIDRQLKFLQSDMHSGLSAPVPSHLSKLSKNSHTGWIIVVIIIVVLAIAATAAYVLYPQLFG